MNLRPLNFKYYPLIDSPNVACLKGMPQIFLKNTLEEA